MRNGFTLIELLAVIVILVIISLIAVPVVVNIINDSKKSSEEESLKLYEGAVNKMIVKKQMTDVSFNPKQCTILSDGNLDCEGIPVTVEVKGKTPNRGTVIIGGNKISFKNVEFNGKTYYKESYAKLVNDADHSGTVSIGDEYIYKVNDTDTFNFYVLSIEGDKVNLIMDRNICNDGTVTYIESNNYCKYAWYTLVNDNSFGPVTAMTELGNATRNWTNVSNMNLQYNDITDQTSVGYTESTTYGYNGITITDGVGYITKKDGTTQTPITLTDNKPLKARLPKYSEIYGTDESHCTDNAGTCPTWLVANMKYRDVSSYTESGNTDKYSMNNNNETYQNIYGYWLLSSAPFYSSISRVVNYEGNAYSSYLGVTDSYFWGIRPVITVSKSEL